MNQQIKEIIILITLTIIGGIIFWLTTEPWIDKKYPLEEEVKEKYCYDFIEDFLIDCKEELLKVRPELSSKYIECEKWLLGGDCGCKIYTTKHIDPAFENENIKKKEKITGINLEEFTYFEVKENALKRTEECY